MFKTEVKKLKIQKFWKAFVFLFLISFLIINWNEISWIFNYRTVSGLFLNFFEKNDGTVEKIDFDNGQDNFYEKESRLEMPKIGVSSPLIFTETTGPKEIVKFLDFGAVHFFDSVLPGGEGQTIILGHSAPLGWPEIKHDWIFTRISELEDGDKIIIYFKKKKLTYSVTNKFFLEKGEKIPEYLADAGNILILISCWPPGKDIRRIAVEARLE